MVKGMRVQMGGCWTVVGSLELGGGVSAGKRLGRSPALTELWGGWTRWRGAWKLRALWGCELIVWWVSWELREFLGG